MNANIAHLVTPIYRLTQASTMHLLLCAYILGTDHILLSGWQQR